VEIKRVGLNRAEPQCSCGYGDSNAPIPPDWHKQYYPGLWEGRGLRLAVVPLASDRVEPLSADLLRLQPPVDRFLLLQG
jgi:hypothetical protein